MDKVSIIVPIYNGDKYLKRCIDSLLSQTYNNIEVVCVNDGSTDKTLEILQGYSSKDSRIVIIDKQNTGVSDSRNMAIKKASGDYICFCDVDDVYEKKYVEIMYNLMIQNDVSLVRCNYNVINENGKNIDKGYVEPGLCNFFEIKNSVIPSCLDGTMPCFSYLLMIKKTCLKSKFPVDVAMMEDVVFYIDLLSRIDRLYVTNECLYTIMFNENGATNNVHNYKRNVKHILLVNEKIKRLLKDNKINTNDNVTKINVNNLNSIADFIFNYYLHGNDAIKFCKEIDSEELDNLIKTTDLSKINFVRKILLKLILKKRYVLLNGYFKTRKIIHKIKSR